MDQKIKVEQKNAKPFLRWAGGKRWLISELKQFLPQEGFNNYHEPFLGGGAIFFHLQQNKSFLSDLNKDLVTTYLAVRDDVDNVIKYLKAFKNTEEDYYRIRCQNFRLSAKKAAQFIYLNQTSFNGIYRVNQKGKYNVPYGKRNNISFNYENLYLAHEALQNAVISSKDFYDSIHEIEEGDLVFLDPPYTVTHNNNGFITYNQKLFSIDQQYRLAEMIKEVRRKNAYYIMTNAAHPEIIEIFGNGDQIFELKRNSLIGAKSSSRGKYEEIVLTNGVK